MKHSKWLSMLSLVALAIPTVVANQVIFATEAEKAVEGAPAMNPLGQTGQAPVIFANDRPLYVGDFFNPLEGVYFYDHEDGSSQPALENVIYDDVDMNQPGKYKVTYAIEDSDHNRTEKSITVTVLDHIADIVFPQNPIVISQHSTFNPLPQSLGITSHDSQGVDTTDSIFILENNVDTSKAGTYNITYCVPSIHGDPVVIKKLNVSVVRTK
ncbi:TPA: immunoglobulin-like domain-containing protein [Enterococcus faecium]|uniref:immunoglobulin-like domain-containing protein n=1 Tax=Enterococcus mundtii TaxID=53346 RepID=UPI002DBA32E6|nr:immunoglobulin-like domain-containing protein [Enterococcus mundtii]MEC3942675.1 immunoglobulin-like domain-containing protein [Enterococcus mundtii]